MMDELSRWYENLNYQEAKDILREKLDNMKMNFIAAGYYMKYIRDNELFREDGYESIWEFAEDNYGIKKSTASRWMAMNDKFSQGGNSPILADEYRGFEKSQLQEMLYLDDKQIETVTTDMTVKEIREVRKQEKKESPIDRGYRCITGKKWLWNYQKWGIWYEDKNIGARYYKYDSPNGAQADCGRIYHSSHGMVRRVHIFISASCLRFGAPEERVYNQMAEAQSV